MNKMYFSIAAVVVAIFFSTVNFFYSKNSYVAMALDLASLESLAQSESSGCPEYKCDPGGCGSASCTISVSYPLGFGSTKSVTAHSGYFACCYKDWFGNTYANSFPNSCCVGPIYP